MVERNEADPKRLLKGQAPEGTPGSIQMHAETAPNGTVYYSRPVSAYPEVNAAMLLMTRLVSCNGQDLTRREYLKYLQDARKHGLC